MASSESTDLFSAAVPDPEHTLGGVKDDVEPAHPSVIMHMVRSLMPGQDLTRVTIPPFYLEPRSLLDRMADMEMHPDLLLGVSTIPDPVERIKAVARWYLSGWHYRTVGVQKPYNPIVGETFACYWKHPDGSRTQYFAEQVLHRPPITAIYAENRAHNFVVNAHVWTKSQFNAPQTVASILEGASVLTLTNLGEEYWITFPTYYAHNLLIGTLRMEVGDKARIICVKTGLHVDIDFHQMGTFSSSTVQSSLTAHIRRLIPGTAKAGTGPFHSSAKSTDLFVIQGHWNTQLYIADAAAAAKSDKGALFIDLAAEPVAPKYVLPIDMQGPWESRRLWKHASLELSKRPIVNWDMVDREKLQLEEEQRLLRCHLKESDPEYEEWATKKFHRVPMHDPISGKEVQYFSFDDLSKAPAAAGAPERNLLELSRTLPDPRGGLHGVGAVPAVVAATRSIKLSVRRQADFAVEDAAAKASS